MSSKRKLWFLTRTYAPQTSGGALVRSAQVRHLGPFFDVTVVAPGDLFSAEQGIMRISDGVPSRLKRLNVWMERLGVLDDYLDPWARVAFRRLKEMVNKDDLVFATSGGELGTLILGVYLKNEVGCRLVANLHDPIDYCSIRGERIPSKWHVSRDKAEKRLLEKCDLIITSTNFYKDSISEKYPNLKSRLVNWYFGYDSREIRARRKVFGEKLRIGYAGAFSGVQAPESLANAVQSSPELSRHVSVVYVGNFRSYQPVLDLADKSWIELHPLMPRGELLEFFSESIDVAYASLAHNYFSACFPSKIYDYIGMNIPVIGMLPLGDANSVIENNGFGKVCDIGSSDQLSSIIKMCLDKHWLSSCADRIELEKERWSMEHTSKDVVALLLSL